MITIIYSTHKDSDYNNKFKQHLLQTVGLKDVQILEYQNNNQYSLSQVYNRGISESIYDILVCCHNDIKLENGWGKKLLNDFETNPDFSIIGKAGSCYFPESGVYWERMNETMVGQVYHHPEGQKKWLNSYSSKIPELTPTVTIDGLFISFNKRKIKHTFDESIGKFHFYDHLFCIPNYLEGIKIGVTSSFEITHQSIGQPNEEFFISKSKFLEKYGSVLPLDLKPSKIYVPSIKDKSFKISGKIAVVIPTKGKVNMLFECVNSFYEHCNSELFTVFIADTGSSNDEKEFIKNNILILGDVRLIEYDYYNFAKINNDVVKNYVTDEFEFLLFCNNDIKLLNNVILGMLSVFKEKPNTGTVGCRLHFENNTVQHDGILAFIDSNNTFQVSHFGLFGYYTYSNHLREVFGNTGALMMIRKNTFIKCGMFNEKYINCFEDVELNISCMVNGHTNYCDGRLVAYHYESQTRNEDPDKLSKLLSDYRNNLFPYVLKHFNKIKNKLVISKK
jgi:GT2 family glycosyltransferase